MQLHPDYTYRLASTSEEPAFVRYPLPWEDCHPSPCSRSRSVRPPVQPETPIQSSLPCRLGKRRVLPWLWQQQVVPIGPGGSGLPALGVPTTGNELLSGRGKRRLV
jgi:hypothetical protein